MNVDSLRVYTERITSFVAFTLNNLLNKKTPTVFIFGHLHKTRKPDFNLIPICCVFIYLFYVIVVKHICRLEWKGAQISMKNIVKDAC